MGQDKTKPTQLSKETLWEHALASFPKDGDDSVKRFKVSSLDAFAGNCLNIKSKEEKGNEPLDNVKAFSKPKDQP